MTRPMLLDLYCKAGGAAMGYHRAGFTVVGIDIEPQPNYPFEFVQNDAIEYLLKRGHEFDVIHASPPCHDHSPLKSRVGADGTGWLLDATRQALKFIGGPWVIENVMAADMRRDVMLCGEYFDLRTVRHRKFELWREDAIENPKHPKLPHERKTSTKKRRACLDAGMNISVTGDVYDYVGPPCMGIDWMTGTELAQAIPPAYTEYIGKQLMGAL